LKLRPPVVPFVVTSRFQEARPNPLDGGKSVRPHKAIDLKAADGQLVFAAANGLVLKSYVSTRGPLNPRTGRPFWYAYGERVVLRHPGGSQTTYNHLRERFVAQGDEVLAGRPIGRAGSTGDSTGPHLHFELLVDGEFVDPTPLVELEDHPEGTKETDDA